MDKFEFPQVRARWLAGCHPGDSVGVAPRPGVVETAPVAQVPMRLIKSGVAAVSACPKAGSIHNSLGSAAAPNS